MTAKKSGPIRSILNLLVRGTLQADLTALRVAAIEDRLAVFDGGAGADGCKKTALAALTRDATPREQEALRGIKLE